MGMANCTKCCKRWYITFDGIECGNPVPMDVVIYTEVKNSIHQPRTIDGHCFHYKSGEVNVEFRIRNCYGFRNSDGYTGWRSSSRIYIEEVFPSQFDTNKINEEEEVYT